MMPMQPKMKQGNRREEQQQEEERQNVRVI